MCGGIAEGVQVKIPERDHSLRSATYWRDKAKEARNLAEDMADGFAKNMMLEIASMYARLEKRAAAAEAEKAQERERS